MSTEFLTQLIGEWSGTTKTWFEPGALADESPWHGTFRLTPYGQFIRHEYEGQMQGKSFTGEQTWCYNAKLQRWECSWIDSFHNSGEIMYSVGTGEEPNVLGQWHVDDGTAWGWRTTLSQPSQDELLMQMYIITPDGEESLGVETRYTRRQATVSPVPAGRNSLSPYLIVPEGARLIEFLQQAFGGVELGRVQRPDSPAIMHAEVKIGDSVVMLADATPQFAALQSMLHLYVADVDAAYQGALDAGATAIAAPVDHPDGDRRAGVLGPCGNQWWIATHKADVAWGETK